MYHKTLNLLYLLSIPLYYRINQNSETMTHKTGNLYISRLNNEIYSFLHLALLKLEGEHKKSLLISVKNLDTGFNLTEKIEYFEANYDIIIN